MALLHKINAKKPELSVDLAEITADVLEFEYAITSPKVKRCILRTDGVGYCESFACTGVAIYDNYNRIGALAHIFIHDNKRFYELFEEIIESMNSAGAHFVQMTYIGKYLVEDLKKGLFSSHAELKRKGKITGNFQHLPLTGAAMDTQDGSFYCLPQQPLSLPFSHPSERGYGFNRYNPETGRPQWSRAYPNEFPVDLRSPLKSP